MVFVLVNTQNEDKNYFINIPDLKLQNVKLFRTAETENFIEDKSSLSVRDNIIQIKSKRKSVISFTVSF